MVRDEEEQCILIKKKQWTATEHFWKSRENLLKDGRYVVYEDEDVLIYQERSGYEPLYMLWAIVKNEGEHGIHRHLDKWFSDKFKDYWYEKSCYGIRDNSVKLVADIDFGFVFERPCKRPKRKHKRN